MILASVSLLALVTSARPLPEPDEHWKALQLSVNEAGEPAASAAQQAIQTVVKSLASDDYEEDPTKQGEGTTGSSTRIHFVSEEEVQAYLSAADSDAVKLVVPLGNNDMSTMHSIDEQELIALLNRLEAQRVAGGRLSPVPDSAIDSFPITKGMLPSSANQGSLDTISGEEDDSNGMKEKDSESTRGLDLPFVSVTPPVLVLLGASAAALLALACIATGLYLAALVRASLFRAQTAWRILPKLEAGVRERGGIRTVAERVQAEGLLEAGRKAPTQDEELKRSKLQVLLEKNSSTCIALGNENLRGAEVVQQTEKPVIILNDVYDDDDNNNKIERERKIDNDKNDDNTNDKSPLLLLDLDTDQNEKFYDFVDVDVGDGEDSDSISATTGTGSPSPLVYATPTAALSPAIGNVELPLLAAAAAIAAACISAASANSNLAAPNPSISTFSTSREPEMRETATYTGQTTLTTAGSTCNTAIHSNGSTSSTYVSSMPSSESGTSLLHIPGALPISIPTSISTAHPNTNPNTNTNTNNTNAGPASIATATAAAAAAPAPALPALLLALQLHALPSAVEGAWLVRAVVALVGWLGVLVGNANANANGQAHTRARLAPAPGAGAAPVLR